MATSDDPTQSEPALQRAARCLAEGHLDDAIDLLSRITAAAPNYAAAHVLHASALNAAGDVAAALLAWNQASVLVPRSPVVLRERSKVMDAIAAAPAEPDVRSPDASAEPLPVLPVYDRILDSLEHDLVAREATPDTPEQAGELTNQLDAPAIAPELPSIVVDSPELSTSSDKMEALPFEQFQQDDIATPTSEIGGDSALPPDHRTLELQDLLTGPQELELLSPEATDEPATTENGDAGRDDWTLLMEEVEKQEAPPESQVSILAPEESMSTRRPSSAQPVAESTAGFSVSDELDTLISRLEDAPRIRPSPTYDGPMVSINDAAVDELASETLAQIYAAQDQYSEAADVYERLAVQQPDRADTFLQHAAKMRQRA